MFVQEKSTSGCYRQVFLHRGIQTCMANVTRNTMQCLYCCTMVLVISKKWLCVCAIHLRIWLLYRFFSLVSTVRVAVCYHGVVTPICIVVTAKTGVKKF